MYLRPMIGSLLTQLTRLPLVATATRLEAADSFGTKW